MPIGYNHQTELKKGEIILNIPKKILVRKNKIKPKSIKEQQNTERFSPPPFPYSDAHELPEKHTSCSEIFFSCKARLSDKS